jgi:Na+/H+-dicarboxylate symporter
MPENNGDTKKRLSLTSWIVIALAAGLLSGLLFGEYTVAVKWLGDAFVGLLQMAVLPYITISLIVNIGSLSVRSGWRLLRASLLVMSLLWLVGILVLAGISQAFPPWEAGSFFSTQFTEEPQSPDWLNLFIPANPFRSLSQNDIPAVVVFCLGLGIALMAIPGKQRLLEPLEVLVDALSNLNRLVVRLTPLGLFGIVAHAAGTIDLTQFSLIQGYLLSYAAAALVVSFVFLPLLIAALTPLPARQVLQTIRGPLVAAFVIGNSFVVLPMIIEAIDDLMERYRSTKAIGSLDQADYLVPLAYPFPDIGRIVGLVFIPFAAWFYGIILDSQLLPQWLGVGLLGSFAKPVITIPLLLNLAELPSDIFGLWLSSGVLAARFGDLMKTAHLFSFAILTIAVLNGVVRLKVFRLLATIAVSLLLLAAAAVAIRVYLDAVFAERYSRDQLVTERVLVFPEQHRRVADTPIQVLNQSAAHPRPLREGQTRLQRIREYGKLRVGFDPEKLPFCYFNDAGQLIGLDIQMAFYLAHDLQAGLEFVPLDRERLEQQLADDHFDLAMSAMQGTVARAARLPAFDPYMFITLAVVVPDHNKYQFRNRDSLNEIPDLRLAAVRGSLFAERAPDLLPAGSFIQLDSAAEYFAGRYRDVHGLVIGAESGSAWTLRFPGFSVANPLQGEVRIPLYYLTDNDEEFEDFLRNWFTLRKADGTFQRAYEYWILGVQETGQTPRWCLLRDVLGWIR